MFGNRKNLISAISFSIVAMATHSVAEEAERQVTLPIIPAVSADVMKNRSKPTNNLAVKTNVSKVSVKSGTTGAINSAAKITDSTEIKAEFGVNQMLPVSIGHLNRIVTPFSNPKVKSTSSATIKVSQNVIYVGTNDEAPVSLFVTEYGTETKALSLTLMPQKIPPREVRITFKGDSSGFTGLIGSNPIAEKWETTDSYVATLTELLKSIALNSIPSGYAIGSPQKNETLPFCDVAGLDIDFSSGQVARGGKLQVNIGVAKNISGRPVEFKGHLCANWYTAAATSWPHTVIMPGQKTEVYVVLKTDAIRKAKQQQQGRSGYRKPLIGGRS